MFILIIGFVLNYWRKSGKGSWAILDCNYMLIRRTKEMLTYHLVSYILQNEPGQEFIAC